MSNPVTKIRKEKGISRMELCRKSGIAYMTLTAIENGLNNTMRDTTAADIAKFAKADPEHVKKQYTQWKEDLKHA